MGNRIAKHVTKSGHTVSTYYFLDAQGNQMAMYQHKNEEENGISNNNLYLSERNLYGSSRIGQEQIGEIIASSDLNLVNINTATQNIIGDKYFEMSNHLGNVLEVVTDRKLPVPDGNGNIDYFLADVVSYSDYYPGGMLMPGRSGSSNSYDYGFNGMLKDDEIKGEGNSYDFGARMYDPRVGRFLSIDPKFKKFAELSPYNAFNSNPIVFADPTGESGIVTITEGVDGNPGTIKISMSAVLYGKGASPELAAATKSSLMKSFESQILTYMVNGSEYNVELDLEVSSHSDASAFDGAQGAFSNSSPNDDYSLNFIRVEDFNQAQKIKGDSDGWAAFSYGHEQGSVSEWGQAGGNSGFIITDDILSDPTTLLHELFHGLFSEHNMVDKLVSEVAMSLPKNTPADLFSNIEKNMQTLDSKGKQVLDASKRVITKEDLNIIFRQMGFEINNSRDGVNGVEFNNGVNETNVGKLDNNIYGSDGNVDNSRTTPRSN